jgi:pimeloyl-ACP methyl ester carboxylesterase
MPYADNEGTKLYWEERGSGEPLLLIMGLGYTLDMWHRILPALAEHYRVIAFDNRGVGRSDVPPGPYTMMASDAAAVMDVAGIEAAHVLGVSLGGMIAQEFALQYPARVRSLILGCTTCGGAGAVTAEPEVITALVARAKMTVEEAIHVMTNYVYDAGTPRERLEEDFEIRRRTYPGSEGYLAQLQATFGWESFSRLSQIRVPTLVIHGESDRLVPPGNGKLLADNIAGARLAMLPAASHIFMTDQPEQTNQAILSFLAANRAGSKAV